MAQPRKLYMTDPWVGAVTVEQRTDFHDTQQPGLMLRVGVGLEPARTWYVRYRAAGRRRRLKLGTYPTTTLAKARESAKAKLRRVDDGGDPQREQREAEAARIRAEAIATETTVEALAERWFAYLPHHVTRRGRRISPRTVEQYTGLARKYILPALGKRVVTDVTRGDVEDLHGHVTRRGGSYVANRVVNVLSIFYTRLQATKLVPDGLNPARRPPRNPELRRGEDASVRLSPEQEGRLVAAIYAEMERDAAGATALLVLLDTGRRLREVLGLQWRRLNLAAGTADLGATKGKAAGDVCYLPPRTREALRALPRVVGVPFVFTGNGPGGRRRGLQSVWSRVKVAAGLEVLSPDLEGFRVHDLRHHRISELLAAGVAPQLVARQVGHTSLEQLKTYSHLEVRDVAAVLSRLESVGPAAPAVVTRHRGKR